MDARKELIAAEISRNWESAISLLKWLINTAILLSGGALLATLGFVDKDLTEVIIPSIIFILSIILAINGAYAAFKFHTRRSNRNYKNLWDDVDFDKSCEEYEKMHFADEEDVTFKMHAPVFFAYVLFFAGCFSLAFVR